MAFVMWLLGCYIQLLKCIFLLNIPQSAKILAKCPTNLTKKSVCMCKKVSTVHLLLNINVVLPNCKLSLPADWAELIPLSRRHWKIPRS